MRKPLGIIGNAGGVNVLAADAAEPAGLRIAPASESLRAPLGRLVRGAGNPVDLGAAATPAAFATVLDIVAGSREMDAVMVVVAATRANNVDAILDALTPVVDRYGQLPVAVVVVGAQSAMSVGKRRAPVFDLPERAVSALGRSARYAAWRGEELGGQPQLPGVQTDVARSSVAAALAGRLASAAAFGGRP